MIRTMSIFKSIQQGLLICNKEGKIVYFNDSYGEFIGKSLAETVGTPIKNLRPGSIIFSVLKNGKMRENVFRVEGNQEYFVNVYPIIDNDEMSGTVSIVTRIDKEKLKTKSKKTLQERVKEFEKKEIEEMLFLYGYDMEGKNKVANELGISLATLYNKLHF